MKNLLTLTTACLLAAGLSAQSIDRSAVSSGGESTEASGLYLDYTIGELMTETMESGNLIITQGMQQPDLIVVRINENESWEGWSVYPNPASKMLHIKAPVEAVKIYSYSLTDRQGHRLLQEFGCAGSQEVSVEKIPAGQFTLTLMADSLGQLISFKIIKIN